MTALALGLLLAASAAAKGDEKPLEPAPLPDAAVDSSTLVKESQVSDPEMLKEVAGADSANLSNAMAKGRSDAERAAGFFVALAASAKAQAEALKSELSADLPDADAREDLALHAAALREKDGAFRKAAAARGFKVPAADAEKLLGARRTYPAADRRRDVSLAEDFLKKADRRRKVDLDAGEKAMADAAAAFVSEAAALSRLVDGLGGDLAKRSAPRRQALSLDVDALRSEARALAATLRLAAHDQADFDAAPSKDDD